MTIQEFVAALHKAREMGMTTEVTLKELGRDTYERAVAYSMDQFPADVRFADTARTLYVYPPRKGDGF